MFEYYKWKLANKPIGRVGSNASEPPVLGRKAWGIALLLGIAVSASTQFAPLGGMAIMGASFISIGVISVWLLTHLKEKSVKEMGARLLQSLMVIMTFLVLMGLSFGGVAVAAHHLMRDTHHLGQIAQAIDWVTRMITLAVAPVMSVTLFRFVDGKSIFSKIHHQTYVEFFIIFTVGLLLSWLPNQIVLRSLMMTQIVQFLFLTCINTLLITTVITTARSRGMLK